MFQSKREYAILNRMLDAAIDGTFDETEFDETELSKFQSKFKRFLQMSSMSKHQVDRERNQLQELITNISHQTKTPLTNIKLYSELLTEQGLEGEAKDFVKEICIHADKLEQLIQALVKISRLETGIFQYMIEKQSLAEMGREAILQAGGKARAKEVILQCDLEDDITAHFDKKWTLEAVGNILDNAIKYSPKQSRITVTTFSYEMFVGLSITDEGAGIAEEEIPCIFGRFCRGKAVADAEGIGVGLYLARQIVEGQGGYIKVKSRQGQGSTFGVYLPR